ncbi:type I-D CRISPR-associated protein Cas10d/Csc3 [Methanospirillum hungatei]|uniref:type I-D CRISPR-associated protein Cas10d/Csc3 n=1 Tax=Methanospirillum hungatei TaxID=2203 RepID=UPI0026EC4E34|nr:type I-D CRISPR-associated protein Cas10d/Csc3 [Methanospirillum hungatei]MCA1915892.1 type I-D CRISPR-associated protein Cas10d/Csc3 [Methanospirillum hungatei]
MRTKKITSVFSHDMLFGEGHDDHGDIQDDYDLLLYEYFKTIDHPLRTSKYAYMPAKSVEFGKTDQPMINHVRNGIQALIELNKTLLQSGSSHYLPVLKLREVIALFSIHDLHKTIGKDWREQFDLDEDEVMSFAHAIQADIFAPALTPNDFLSVAVATHPTQGFHGDLSQSFIQYKTWVLLADIFASLEMPVVTEGMKKHIAFIDAGKTFYYHTFSESIGLLSNLVHAAVSEWAKQYALFPLLFFEKGVIYLGDKNCSLEFTKSGQIEEIYQELKKKIQSSHESLSRAETLQKYIQVQGSKGLFSVEESFFFYSGIHTVIKAFLAAAVMTSEKDNSGNFEIDTSTPSLTLNKSDLEMQYPPAEVIDVPAHFIKSISVNGNVIPVSDVRIICHGEERKAKKYTLVPDSVFVGEEEVFGLITITGIGLMPSMVGYRSHILSDFGVDIGWDESIIPLARAVSGIRKDIITELIKSGSLPTDDPLLETCRLFQINEDLTQKMVTYALEHRGQDHHSVGGFWNYSYAIARDLLDREVNGIAFSQIASIQEKISYLNALVDEYLSTISQEKLEKFESAILYPYKEKLLVWLCENLSINGSMLYGSFENKTNKFQAYCKGSGICRLTNDTPYDKERKTTSMDVSMLKYSFSNRVPIGSSEPSLYVSVPVQIELGLRSIGHGIRKGSDKIYFRLIPDYHFSHTTASIFSQFANYFDGDSGTRILDLAREFLREGLPSEDSIVGLLIAETGRKNICQYAGLGFSYQNSTFDFVFNKKRNGDGEYWFFASYLALILAYVTGCRVIAGENPICMTSGDEFSEFVLLEAPHVAIKRIFSDRIRLSDLKKTLLTASLIISMGYEIRMDDAAFVRFLQTFRNHPFPGSTLLKQIRRVYEQDKKKGGMGGFVNSARGWRKVDGEIIRSEYPGFIFQAVKLDTFGEDPMAVASIHELARLGLSVAIPRNYEPHKVEKLFRESVKAILGKRGSQYPREDYVDAVSGRLLKMIKRAGDDQFSRTQGLYNFSLVVSYAEYFVDHIFYQLASGDPGKLKRAANDLADGFYSATLQLREEYYESRRETSESEQDVTSEQEN